MMTAEPDIIVHNREQLIALLTEAAEIEHGLMCCYLYAAFSLKTTEDCGLSPGQLAATRRWRAVVLEVAIEEMLHLGLVANLMTAIGATPHFARPNFPVSPGYHPSGVIVELARFDADTMDHFVFLERPEGTDIPDGNSFKRNRSYERATRKDVLVPSAQDFLTVGHMYKAISAGMARLVDELGEGGLFIGTPLAQIGPDIGGFDQLIRVTSLATAEAAIEAIVEQGEGSPGDVEDSHYARFCAVRDELKQMLVADPAFDPAWPAARNPVMRKPPIPDGKVHVSAPDTARLLDIGNAAYGLMLRCLMGTFGQPSATDDDRRRLYGTAINLMHAVTPIAEQLARMPAGMDAAIPTAGLTFALPRSIAAVSNPAIALRIIAERASEIAAACAGLGDIRSQLANCADDFKRIAAGLQNAVNKLPDYDAALVQPAQAVQANPVPPLAPASVTTEVAQNTVEEVVGQKITIRFDGKRCIHARFCVLQAPTVFKANTPGTWIFPDTMDADELVAVAENCPSGAISYVRHDGRAGEMPPPVNVARVRENGPYAIHAEIALE
ncbi:MAG: ferritin-like domain-containing protein, partial [Beijerinckiaceae bacterium]